MQQFGTHRVHGQVGALGSRGLKPLESVIERLAGPFDQPVVYSRTRLPGGSSAVAAMASDASVATGDRRPASR